MKNKFKIRYKYVDAKEGFELSKIKCPICGSKHINWTEVVEHTSWTGKVSLLAECWSGNISEDKPRHLVLIRLNGLPIVEVDKIKIKK